MNVTIITQGDKGGAILGVFDSMEKAIMSIHITYSCLGNAKEIPIGGPSRRFDAPNGDVLFVREFQVFGLPEPL